MTLTRRESGHLVRSELCHFRNSCNAAKTTLSLRRHAAERIRGCEADGLGGLEIDDQLDPCRQLDREIGGLCSFEYLVDVIAGAAEQVIIGHYLGCGWSVEQIVALLEQHPDGIGGRYIAEGRLAGEVERSAGKYRTCRTIAQPELWSTDWKREPQSEPPQCQPELEPEPEQELKPDPPIAEPEPQSEQEKDPLAEPEPMPELEEDDVVAEPQLQLPQMFAMA